MVNGGGLEYLNISRPRCCILKNGLAATGAGFGSRLRLLNMRLRGAIGNESAAAIAKCRSLPQKWHLALWQEVSISGWEAGSLQLHTATGGNVMIKEEDRLTIGPAWASGDHARTDV
ncbi:hypothetical protein Ancab_020019 [Ancistrocladus abbreviatus]